MSIRVITPPRLSVIAAVAENGVIGRGLDLPWHLRSDLQHFKALTQFKPVIMGSTTWDSLPKKPLPGRLNLVLSRDVKFEAEGAIVCASLFEALELAREHALDDGADDICIIGGANLYAQALPKADRLYITRVHAAPEGDVLFPDIDKSQWVEVESRFHAKSDGDDFDFTTLIYDRRGNSP
jgi:dihydrofolate reductase